MADAKVTALEVQTLYSVDNADLKTTALETQVLYSKPEVIYSGIETQLYSEEASIVVGLGVELQAWVSTAQLSSNPAKVKAAWLYY